jgi:SAM-dependent methyltransferase
MSGAGGDLPFSPAAERNRAPILDVLARLLPGPARVLEIASGTGQHAAHFGAARADWAWQPSEGHREALASIAQRCAGLGNVAAPLHIDVLAPWPVEPASFDAVYCANLLHIAPAGVGAALFAGARNALAADGVVLLYGPYFVDGEAPAAGNVAFDADLRSRDPAWGVRRLGEVARQGADAGFALAERIAMPANNLLLVWRRVSA